ncbi:Uncharacterized conserved protein [Microbulbifer donghaiensis]|uniref:Uncharacterized conserved protein n=1 Tax=Microbulbifer donghaiensis TaxID=494016 RepID=A0A1M5FY05_9GAMM|nr:GFA family protein [Microbulbifer donghaiensis]SHF96274.1 Uncharacterized conserved protein [Microbulbifer donghaiensis]
MVKGECSCGKVTYEIKQELSDVYICHCSLCRRSTGSGGIAVAVAPKEKFKWLKGEEDIKYWAMPGHDWHTNFCSTCGSTLPAENDSSSIYVPVGTLISGFESLKVAHHIWVASKANWEEICDSGKQHAEGIGS